MNIWHEGFQLGFEGRYERGADTGASGLWVTWEITEAFIFIVNYLAVYYDSQL